ncbi:MAG: hypothetical protein QM813_12070 [Verrucomicrobiota bacterium]
MEIQNRVTNHYSNVILFKPATPNANDESSAPPQLAPLMILEVISANSPDLWKHPLPQKNKPPRIQAHKNSLLIDNRWHWQWTYTWDEATSPAGAPRFQGVRVTLDSRDAPVIWEILADTSAYEIIYVSQTLDWAARAEFGPPLPGRKFSIERSLAASPKVVVANVIEDGPTTIGPILYQQASNRDITALICRCMPAQFKNLIAQEDYKLLAAPSKKRGKSIFSPTPLEQRLRLPSRF